MDFKSDEGFLFDEEERIEAETLQKIQNLVESIHIDNMMILRALMCCHCLKVLQRPGFALPTHHCIKVLTCTSFFPFVTTKLMF